MTDARDGAVASEEREDPRTVEAYMAEALYEPERGYYMRPHTTVGRAGDFSTSATLHPALAECILRWAAHLPRPRGGRLSLVEMGGGSGHIAAAILRAAGWWGRRKVDYRVVEISPSLEAVQRERLARRHVRWFRDVSSAVAGLDAPVLFSNEFVDAFPCRQFVRRADAWLERRVAPDAEGRPRLSSGPAAAGAPLPPSAALDPATWPKGTVPDRQIVEVHESYRRWLQTATEGLEGPAHLLTIDYGDTQPPLYVGRLRGALRGYYKHQRFEDEQVFLHPGRMDLTADVNFTDLERWGDALGWRRRAYDIQRDFMIRWMHPSRRRSTHPALRFLLDPDGAGSGFKVLWQERSG